MPRRKQLAITERQFEMLSLLWEHGPMTVRELLDRLERQQPLPYTTVLGLLQNMERAGLATHDGNSGRPTERPTRATLAHRCCARIVVDTHLAEIVAKGRFHAFSRGS